MKVGTNLVVAALLGNSASGGGDRFQRYYLSLVKKMCSS